MEVRTGAEHRSGPNGTRMGVGEKLIAGSRNGKEIDGG